jgi:DNA-binding transcriptional LysR family regulator
VPRHYYKQNRLKQLRAFCHAARSENMSRAATQMYLSQPAISLLIQSLEKELGGQLFERQGPKIRLTTEGKLLFEMALPLVESIENLPHAFYDRCHNQVTGHLAIAAGESTTLYLLPGYVQPFQERFPQIQLRLHNVPGHEGVKLVQSGAVDFAVGPIVDVPDDIWYLPLTSYEPILITPRDHPLAGKDKLTLEDLRPYGLILPPQSMATRKLIDVVFQQHNFDYRITMEAGGWEVIKKYVEMGLGISIVTSICLTGNEKIARCSLSDYFPQRSYGLILRHGKFISPAARKFIEIMGMDVLENLAPGGGQTGQGNA